MSTAGSICVRESCSVEVMELPMLPEPAVAEMEDETHRLPLLVLSVSVEADRWR